jgi:hypothetical protein
VRGSPPPLAVRDIGHRAAIARNRLRECQA